MPSNKISFNNLKPNIAKAIKESCPTADGIIYKIADQTYQIKTKGVEPGVEIAEGLSTVIDATIKSAVGLGCDLAVITEGILIGSFRSRSVELEAHKTIRLLIHEIIQAVFDSKGDIKKAIKGILDGIAAAAEEHKLNRQEASRIAVENILLYSKETNPQFVQDIKASIPKEYEGLK
jgi:hypothetical protein